MTPGSDARLAVMEQIQAGLQADLSEIKDLLRQAVAVGQEDRRQLNDRLTRLEVRSESYVSFRQLVGWVCASAVTGMGLATGVAQLLERL